MNPTNFLRKNLQDSYLTEDEKISKAIEVDELVKGKKANIGEIRTWNGKKVQKTVNGWVPAGDNEKESGKIIDFSFNNRNDFYSARSILLKANFRNSENGNPPTGKEQGSFSADERWNVITVTKNSKLARELLKTINKTEKEKKPMGYVPHNHGGYLD